VLCVGVLCVGVRALVGCLACGCMRACAQPRPALPLWVAGSCRPPSCHLCAVPPRSKGQSCMSLHAGAALLFPRPRLRCQRGPLQSPAPAARAAGHGRHRLKMTAPLQAAGGFLRCSASGLAGRSNQAQAGAIVLSNLSYTLIHVPPAGRAATRSCFWSAGRCTSWPPPRRASRPARWRRSWACCTTTWSPS